MDVVHGQQQRAFGRVRAQQPPQPGRVGAVVRVGRDVRELRCRGQQMPHRGEGHRGVLGGAAHAQHPQTVFRGVLGGGLQRGGAAGARGAAQHDEAHAAPDRARSTSAATSASAPSRSRARNGPLIAAS